MEMVGKEYEENVGGRMMLIEPASKWRVSESMRVVEEYDENIRMSAEYNERVSEEYGGECRRGI